MSAIRAAWGWIAGGALALIAGLLLWNHRRVLVSKARGEAAWATKEAERLSRVRAEKLTKADADAAQVELLGKRATWLGSWRKKALRLPRHRPPQSSWWTRI